MIEPILLAWTLTGIVIDLIGSLYEAGRGHDTRPDPIVAASNIVLWPLFLYEIAERSKYRR